jgi:hypothetical protein
MQRVFDKGGEKAIARVMRESPAIFLKMLVLLVPREMQIEHSGTVKEMTDCQCRFNSPHLCRSKIPQAA